MTHVFVAAGLCVGDNAIGTRVANVGAVKLRAPARAAVSHRVGDLVEHVDDGADGAARGGVEVLVDLGPGAGGGGGVLGIRLGHAEGGVDDARLRAVAVVLDDDALRLLRGAEGAVYLGRLDAVDLGLDRVRAVEDLADDLVAAFYGISEAALGADVEVTAGAEVV